MHNAKYLATRDQDRFVSPENWDFSIYSFDPKSFWYSKTNLPLSDDFEIVRYDFRGRVRFNAGLRKKGLQLNFIDSYSTAQSRLQGMGKINSILMITIGGHDWDGLSDVGALGIELNFSESLASQILTPEVLFAMENMRKLFGSGRSIVVHPSAAALGLKNLALKVLGDFDIKTGIRFDDVNSNLDLPSINIPENIEDEFKDEFNYDTLVEMSKNVINEITLDNMIDNRMGSQARRDLALKIETLLWMPPTGSGYLKDITIDELCDILKVSRRTIQLSVQEQFGLGFIAFKRLIRLHQIRALLLKQNSYKSITTIASEHYINHLGRFAGQYRDFFGNLPSKENQIRR